MVRRRPWRIVGPAVGVALAVAALGSLGSFLAMAKAQMTQRAVAQVPVDWQVEVQPGGLAGDVLATVQRRHDVRLAQPVNFGSVPALEATTGGTTQTTGKAVVLGLPPGYASSFPGEVRSLAGGTEGVLLAQQTAANLHAGPGDTVAISRPGLAVAAVHVDAVVDLPSANSLFQTVGAPAGAQPQAPPDNVVLVPTGQWHSLFDEFAGRPDIVRTQVHVRLDHRLPSDPAAAFSRSTRAAHRFEVDVAGAALVGDNLGATLDAARADALYAGVLFIVLGLPGAFVAALLTAAVAATSREARRHELALLRTRGASLGQLQRLVAAEAALIGVAGAGAGIVLAGLVGRWAFGSYTFGATTRSALTWALASVSTGLGVTAAAVALPARHDAAATVAAGRRTVGRPGMPAVLRYGLDIGVLACAGLVFWATSRTQYNLVLAPEGVPTVSVNYWALAGPLLLWAGIGLFAWRLVEATLGRGRRAVRAALRPIAGRLRAPVASMLHRQRRALATGVVLVVLTTTFAISTAVFNTTYRRQVEADALLTNGAAVTVTQLSGAASGSVGAARVARVPGVGHIEAMQHRYAYVGADLQDVFGVDAMTIAGVGALRDAYFAGGGAAKMMGRLARQPDGVLVSAETVKDYQLHAGDPLRLRVRDARSGGLTEVVFRYVGIVREFPTAPTDSFIVANAAFIARQTGDSSASTLLVSTRGASPAAVGDRLRHILGPAGATVSDIDTTRRVVGSSLTAVDLAGLTRVELSFALVLIIAATGLVFALGLAQRRRSLAIVAALGARRGQLAAFVGSEAAVFAGLGGALGVSGGWVLAHLLVKVLTGVFDPPPTTLFVPWLYLGTLALCAAGSLAGAVALQLRPSRRPVVESLRDL